MGNRINKDRFKILTNEKGLSMWLDGTWILDASTFLETGEITIDAGRLKDNKYPEWGTHHVFAYDFEKETQDKDRKIKRLEQELKELKGE